MSIGEILDTGFQLIRSHFLMFLGIGLTASLPSAVLVQLVTETANDPTAASIASLLGLIVFLMVVSPIISAAITHAVSEVYLGRPVSYGQSIRFGIKLLLPLIGTAMLMMLIIFAGLLLLIIPGLYLTLAFLLTYQVMVIENRSGWNALKRTRELSSDNLLRIFAVYFVAMVLMSVVSGGLGLVTMSWPIVSAAVSAVVQAIFAAYMAATLVVIYFDIRCRKEAFDLEHLASLVSGDEPLAVAEN